MKKKDNVIVGLDIGTTKICSIVAEQTETGTSVIGIGTHPSYGLKKGVITNVEKTIECIQEAVKEAEMMAGCEIDHIYAGISGPHIKGIDSSAVVTVKGREIKDSDVKRAVDAASAVSIPPDREVIHIIPQEYIVDDQEGVKNPIGMAGARLEVKVHIITGAVTSAQNIIKCANSCGLNVLDLVLEPLASSMATLTEEEKELGVALIDIGGGTTDILICKNGSVVSTYIIPLGGENITNDISVALKTPVSEAEKIKKKYGCACASMVDKDEVIEIPMVGGRPNKQISRRVLCEIIEARVEELLALIYREIKKGGHEDKLTSGMVLTGGATLLEGIVDFAESLYGVSVRKGMPVEISGLSDILNNPMYATSVGLILYGDKENRSVSQNTNKRKSIFMPKTPSNFYDQMRSKMAKLINEFF